MIFVEGASASQIDAIHVVCPASFNALGVSYVFGPRVTIIDAVAIDVVVTIEVVIAIDAVVVIDVVVTIDVVAIDAVVTVMAIYAVFLNVVRRVIFFGERTGDIVWSASILNRVMLLLKLPF